MSEEPTPYQVSHSGMSPVQESMPPEMYQQSETPVPKVFGILHLIYAVLGAGVAIMGVVSRVVMKMVVESGPKAGEQLKPVMQMWDNMAVYLYVDLAVKVVLGFILFIAGVGLLKRRAWSLKLSFVWSVSRIILVIVMTAWGMHEVAKNQHLLLELQPNSSNEMQQIGQYTGNLVGVVILCIYPIVSLIFLSRTKVRQLMK